MIPAKLQLTQAHVSFPFQQFFGIKFCVHFLKVISSMDWVRLSFLYLEVTRVDNDSLNLVCIAKVVSVHVLLLQ